MDIQKIIDGLEKLPSAIRTCQLTHIEAKDLTERAKLKYDVAFSMAMLKSQEPNATRQKAEAVIATENEKKELLNAELEETKKECELDYRLNSFIEYRKIASLEEKLMQPNHSGN